jgi:hypothetical protein
MVAHYYASDYFLLKKNSLHLKISGGIFKHMAQRNSKFVQMYGLTLVEIAQRLGVSPYKAFTLHLAGKIKRPRPENRCPKCHALILK